MGTITRNDRAATNCKRGRDHGQRHPKEQDMNTLRARVRMRIVRLVLALCAVLVSAQGMSGEALAQAVGAKPSLDPGPQK
jgi:hypothetical protein